MEERTLKITLEKAREWYNKGGELKEVALQAFTEKELVKLPTSWKEYCDMYPIKDEWYIETNSSINFYDVSHKIINISDKNLLPTKEDAEAHLALMQLHRLRDCYRQGEKPDWRKPTPKYCIILNVDKFEITNCTYCKRFLSFPTYTLANEFLNNFKDLIVKAKELI